MLRNLASPQFFRFAIAMVFLLPVNLGAEDLTVSRLFSDHMVLQRDATIAVWGKAAPEAEVDVEFGGVVSTTKAATDGRWTANIVTPKTGGPFDLEIRLKGSEQKIALSDILIGEVWLCSGQSNMEWPVKDSAFAEKEIEGATQFSSVRLFTVERNASVTPLDEPARAIGWEVCSAQTVPNFSAAAYFFACHYHKATGIPVGLVNASWGGTTCEAWTEFEHLRSVPELKELADHFKDVEPAADPAYPGTLFNGMISPLRKFRFAGVLWYQGESNVGRGRQYRDLFPAMIGNWRTRMESGQDLPFYFVQLAPYRYGNAPPEALPEVWDAQLHSWKTVPNTGMVVTTDIGDVADIHPRNKHEVGRRLALWATSRIKRNAEPVAGELPDVATSGKATETLAQGEKKKTPDVPSGPRYRNFRVDGHTIVISFDYTGSGLKVREADELVHFQICGEDKTFVPATVRIEGETVVVSSDAVISPIAVRFGWDDSAIPNLINGEGLPASPFRTDDFPLTSENVSY